ncbi:hypothetical protein OE88DRAFT_1129265 [Heliocybe sulcata]|uniref:Uncharacterized protein n=1 Tax=Heliocybe sulcata TaxID=5364 RepID=A0A5C3N9Z9_9AGAM|nr:hypothetical protein OE88DRAFT_1129265 [Heliocybe sulcata]
MYTTSAITNLSMSSLIAFRIWKATRNIGKNKARYLRVASLLYAKAIHSRSPSGILILC